jgi:hypothetical protein
MSKGHSPLPLFFAHAVPFGYYAKVPSNIKSARSMKVFPSTLQRKLFRREHLTIALAPHLSPNAQPHLAPNAKTIHTHICFAPNAKAIAVTL